MSKRIAVVYQVLRSFETRRDWAVDCDLLFVVKSGRIVFYMSSAHNLF